MYKDKENQHRPFRNIFVGGVSGHVEVEEFLIVGRDLLE